MPSPHATLLGYRPALDGVRGVSIVGVMAFHSGLVPGGWLGVDVFFTLSGFLITTLLVHESETTGDIELRRFYWRRFLRLVPALTILAATCAATTIFTLPEASRAKAMLFVLAVMFYVGNWASITGAPQGLLGHTWSLSIEEQFYLLWPPGVRLLYRRIPARLIFLGLLATAAASIAYRCVAAQSGAEPRLGRYLYLGTLTHADAILIGCAAVFWQGIRSFSCGGVTARIGGIVGLLFIVVALMTVPLDYYFSYWTPTTAIAVATALVIVDVLRSGSWIGRLLELPPCVWVGKRSYGLYLWHFPVFVALSGLSGAHLRYDSGRVLSGWVATFVIAALSYRYIEAPLLRLKSRPPAVLIRDAPRSSRYDSVRGEELARRH
jgi:peptidoglycan/LPS O-acetylase OafA/YrhL